MSGTPSRTSDAQDISSPASYSFSTTPGIYTCVHSHTSDSYVQKYMYHACKTAKCGVPPHAQNTCTGVYINILHSPLTPSGIKCPSPPYLLCNLENLLASCLPSERSLRTGTPQPCPACHGPLSCHLVTASDKHGQAANLAPAPLVGWTGR